jgi:hypothetical protein
MDRYRRSFALAKVKRYRTLEMRWVCGRITWRRSSGIMMYRTGRMTVGAAQLGQR